MWRPPPRRSHGRLSRGFRKAALECRWMGRSFGSRALLAIGGALVILLAGLAAVQYRWSTRVAAADAQRETEHLESAASLFAGEFNGMVGQATRFLQNDAWAALQSRERLAGVPKLIGELYYLDIPPQGAPKVEQLTAGGLFQPSPAPAWMAIPHCATLAIEQPTALVAPVYDIAAAESRSAIGDSYSEDVPMAAGPVFRRANRRIVPARHALPTIDSPELRGESRRGVRFCGGFPRPARPRFLWRPATRRSAEAVLLGTQPARVKRAVGGEPAGRTGGIRATGGDAYREGTRRTLRTFSGRAFGNSRWRIKVCPWLPPSSGRHGANCC